jgi:hypothetical protein
MNECDTLTSELATIQKSLRTPKCNQMKKIKQLKNQLHIIMVYTYI